MKVRKSLRSLKKKPGAQVIRRHGKVFVINKKDPRFKARQGLSLIHISEPTRPCGTSRMPSSA